MLTKIAGNTYYVPGAVNSGVYVPEDGYCVVVDTGLDDQSAKTILKALREAGLSLRTIINTHSHADHCGGNRWLVQATGVPVLASEFEAALVANPSLEPFYLFSAAPLRELQGRFLQAKPSRVDRILIEGDRVEGLQIIGLPGHAPGQLGVATPDGVLFTGDAYFSLDILEKYFVPYFADVTGALQTLDRLAGMDYSWYLPGHGNLATDISATLRANRERLSQIGEFIWEYLTEPRSREDLVQAVVSRYQIVMNPVQYFLTFSAISAHLAHLNNEGRIGFHFTGGRLLWARKEAE